MELATRVQELPPYLFAEIDRKIADARERGVDVISLGIGDPDHPTPSHIIDELVAQSREPHNHRYPSYEGMEALRSAVADWYRRRFGVDLDPQREVVSLIGSKEGIAHIPLCFIDPGDLSLVPDPAYPVYATGTLLAGGTTYSMPLLAENRYQVRFEDIPSDVARRAKLMYLNYPNNPTGAVVPVDLFEEAVRFAREYGVVICHDAAYTEIAFDGCSPPSFLQAKGAREVGIEFHSLSKTFNMTGWRIGWAAGSDFVIEALGRVKTNIDSGIFQAIQYAGIAALSGPSDSVEQMCEVYRERRDIVVDALTGLGWQIVPPEATTYVWAPVPGGVTSGEFATRLLEEAAVVVTPGRGYGECGEGYFRVSLTVPTDRIREAMKRLVESGIRFSE